MPASCQPCEPLTGLARFQTSSNPVGASPGDSRTVPCPPPLYRWADPYYSVVHASIVPCNADLLAGLRGERLPETHGADNLRTMELVFAAYDSAASGEVVRL